MSKDNLGERVQKYRRWAAVAVKRAALATEPGMRDSYLGLAEGWKKLADHIEHAIDTADDELPAENSDGNAPSNPESTGMK